MNKAEELIACLEGEIAKRDARIMELERYDEAVERAAFEAWHKERYPAVKIRVQNLLGTYTDMQVECNFETWLACAESHSKRFGGALLDANARLNGPPVSEAKAQDVVIPETEDFCFCGKHVSLQMISGGASKHGYLGSVTLLIDGKYIEYTRLNAATVQQVSDDELLEVACHHGNGNKARRRAEAIAAQARLGSAILNADGYVRAPVEPTEDMVFAGCAALVGSIGGYEAGLVERCYDAMLAAAPSAPAADAGLVEALELAANRLDRLALEQGEFWCGYAADWADEARATANGVKS